MGNPSPQPAASLVEATVPVPVGPLLKALRVGAGYSAWMQCSPELDLSISILANSDLKFIGECRVENLGNCIALSIFDSYSSNP